MDTPCVKRLRSQSEFFSNSTPKSITEPHVSRPTGDIHTQSLSYRNISHQLADISVDTTTTANHSDYWTCEDDLLLIMSVEHTCDLNLVYLGVKFSRHFSLAHIQSRWYCLLYDKHVSRAALSRIQISARQIAELEHRIPFSMAEERLLRSATEADLEEMQTLLSENRDVFHASRTAGQLLRHCNTTRQYGRLFGSSGNSKRAPESCGSPLQVVDTFSGCGSVSALVYASATRQPGSQAAARATLYGNNVCYMIHEKSAVIGRRSKAFADVDIDLELELGHTVSTRVSRRQAVVTVDGDMAPSIENVGRRRFYVNGCPVTSGHSCQLANDSYIEFGPQLALTFKLNANSSSDKAGKDGGDAMLDD